MRSFMAAGLISLLCACATTKDLAPREILDEKTSATITVVAEPVVFVGNSQIGGLDRARRGFETDVSRDFVELYGIDVNRMGEHRQYFVVQQWLAPQDTDVRPTLELQSDGTTIELQSTDEDPAAIGISNPFARAYSKGSKWWYFPTDTTTLRKVAAAQQLDASLVVGDTRLAYQIFSDGRAQLGELASSLR